MDFSKDINLTCRISSRKQGRLHTFHCFSALLIHIHANSPTTENRIRVLTWVKKKKSNIKKMVYLLVLGLLTQEMSPMIIITVSHVPHVLENFYDPALDNRMSWGFP